MACFSLAPIAWACEGYDPQYYRRICGTGDRSADCYTEVVNRHACRVATPGGQQNSRATQQPSGAPVPGQGENVPPGKTRTSAIGGEVGADPKPPIATGSPIIKKIENPSDPRPLEKARDLDEKAKIKTEEKIAETNREIEQRKGISNFESGLASTIAGMYDSLQNYVQPRQASTNPALQNEAASRLRESLNLPSEYRRVAELTGLRTNSDMQSRALDYVQKWSEDAEKQDKLVAKLEQDNERARLAEKEIGDFQNKLGQRVSDMNSLVGGPQGSAAAGGIAAYPAANAKSLAATSGAKSNRNGQSNITAKSDDGLPSGQSRGISRGLASVGDGKDAASAITSKDDAIIDPKTGKPATGESLRELLKKRLAAMKAGKDGKAAGGAEGGAGKGASGEQKSSFDQFFAGTAGEHGAGKDAADGGKGRGPENPGFFLSGAETDKVVAKLMGSIDSQGAAGGSEVFGSADVSIFQRMTAFLRKAEANKKVAGQ